MLLISSLFIVLAGRVAPKDLLELGWRGPAFLAGLILVVRPVAILLATIGGSATIRERLFLAFLAPRGIVAAAVTSIFALELSHAAHGGLIPESLADQASGMVPLTFCVIVGTVAIYGLLAAPLPGGSNSPRPTPREFSLSGSRIGSSNPPGCSRRWSARF